LVFFGLMKESHTGTEETLVQALKKGDREALGQFYQEGKAAFIKWGEKYFQCRYVEAVDVYQDAVIILYENIAAGKYVQQKDSSIKTYLYAIGKNIFLKKLNKEKKIQDKVIPELSVQPLEDTEQKEKRMQEDELRYDAVMQAFSTMKEPCKSILKYFYYQGLSMRDIAARLGYKSEQVVKSQKVRCLKALKTGALKNLEG
jgi:RNA polymerase sigma factor (sigma-70 family)